MKLTNIGWEWARFYFHKNKVGKAFVFNYSPRPLGFEFYWSTSSNIIYLELGIGTLMLRFVK